ncbi:MAG: amidase family protein [Nitrososphaerales archaeon]
MSFEAKRPLGRIRHLSEEQIRELARLEYMHPSEEEIHELQTLCDKLIESVDEIDDLPQPFLPVKHHERDPGRRPSKEQDPYNAFITKCVVKGAPRGKLLGKKVAIKDSISVQGVLMTNGSRLSETYIPNIDATVVTRLLDEGAVIIGKTNMDDYSFSGTSETSIFGAVRNPTNPDYSPGGSSSGSGAVVAAGDADLAIGVDQGGSARVPAACNGIVSIKATHGLVPSFGIAYLDHTYDFVCPIARTVKEVALALEIIAGNDENDPQWTKYQIKSEKYSEQLEVSKEELSKFRIGIIKESLSWPNIDVDVKESFLDAMEKFRSIKIESDQVSVPMFLESRSIWLAILFHSISEMLDSSGEGYMHGGYYNWLWNEYIGMSRRCRADLFPPMLKGSLIVGRYLRSDYFSVYNSKAQNLRNLFRKEIDKALENFDALATPTMIIKPPKLAEKISFSESSERGVLLLNNTAPFNLTGHPAISIPCGVRQGLPIGLQLISRHFEESKLFKLAFAFESRFDYRKL